MIKIQLEGNSKEVEKYLEQLQKELPQYTVTIHNANDFSVLLEERKNCSKCKGLECCQNKEKGHYTVYENGTFSLVECNYEKEKNSEESLIKTLYLPKNILNAKMESFNTNTESRKKIYRHIMDFIEQCKETIPKKGLYLYGSFSIGKTYTLACIANELVRNNISCLLIYFPDLVVDLKNAMKEKESNRFVEIMNMLKSVDVLMLDDLGSENMSAWVRDEILGPVFNYRVLENKPIFISSNIAPNDMREHFAMEKTPANLLKAERLLSRMNALMLSINMDDSGKYNR